MATQTHRSALPLYRMDVDTYERLVEAGALEGLDVELLDGLLVNKRPHREDAVHRLDVGTYERMVETGALDGLRIELLEGLLVEMSPQSPAHALAIARLTQHFAGAPAELRVQLPLEGDWSSVPEPDLALVAWSHPVHRHPRTALLAIEVAVCSHEIDRGEKAAMYAGAPIPHYWLVDVPGRAVEVRSDPGREGYGRCDVYTPGTHVPSPAEGVAPLDVGALFDGFAD